MAQSANATELTDHNFEEKVLASEQPVLVDFCANWYDPCHEIAPIVEELAEEFDGRAKVGNVNGDEHQHVTQEYGVRSIPTLLFFKDGEVQENLVGVADKASLKQRLEKLLGSEIESS